MGGPAFSIGAGPFTVAAWVTHYCVFKAKKVG
jgi:hypothetical protein